MSDLALTLARRVSAAEARKMLDAYHAHLEGRLEPGADAFDVISEATPTLAETVIALEAERDAATQHTIALEQANISLLRWQSVASEAHVDHLCAIVRSLAVSDETPRTLRDLSAMGVEEEIRRVVVAERINRAKSEETTRTLRSDLEQMEAERDGARADLDVLSRAVGQALVAASLQAGETLADPIPHAIVSTVTRLRAEALGQRADNVQRTMERDDARASIARLHDLVRHQRGALHDAGLITDKEYAALASDTESVARLETYDEMRAEIARLRAEVERPAPKPGDLVTPENVVTNDAYVEWDPCALDEPTRIAEHVREVAPGYRDRARAWLEAEHTDMVEDLAVLMATVSAECCP